MKQEIISLKKWNKMNWWIESTKRFVQLCLYIEHFLILASIITGYISIYAFASLIGITIGITSSAKGLKVYPVTARIKRNKSTIKKKKKKHNKTVLLAQSKLNSNKVLISKALTDSFIRQYEFVLINTVLIKYDKMKEELKNLKI